MIEYDSHIVAERHHFHETLQRRLLLWHRQGSSDTENGRIRTQFMSDDGLLLRRLFSSSSGSLISFSYQHALVSVLDSLLRLRNAWVTEKRSTSQCTRSQEQGELSKLSMPFKLDRSVGHEFGESKVLSESTNQSTAIILDLRGVRQDESSSPAAQNSTGSSGSIRSAPDLFQGKFHFTGFTPFNEYSFLLRSNMRNAIVRNFPLLSCSANTTAHLRTVIPFARSRHPKTCPRAAS